MVVFLHSVRVSSFNDSLNLSFGPDSWAVLNPSLREAAALANVTSRMTTSKSEAVFSNGATVREALGAGEGSVGHIM